MIDDIPSYRFFKANIPRSRSEDDAAKYLLGQPNRFRKFAVNWVTDLGLRKRADAYIIARRCVEAMDGLAHKPIPRRHDEFLLKALSATRVGRASRNRLADHSPQEALSYYVNILGSWWDAFAIARSVLRRMDTLRFADLAYEDKLYTGCTLGILGDKAARELFSAMLKTSRFDNLYEEYTIHFRKLVFSVKRSQSLVDIEEDLSSCRTFCTRSELCDSEKTYFEAMILNLLALHYGKRGEFGKSVDSIQLACEKFARIDFDRLSDAYGGKAVYHRYRLQAMLNLCIVKAAAKDFEGALDHIIPARRHALDYDRQSVFECDFMQAYYNTMLGRHEEAIRALILAIDLLKRDFLCFPTNLFHAKDLLMLNLFKSGRESEAEEIFMKNKQDEDFFVQIGLSKKGEWNE